MSVFRSLRRSLGGVLPRANPRGPARPRPKFTCPASIPCEPAWPRAEFTSLRRPRAGSLHSRANPRGPLRTRAAPREIYAPSRDMAARSLCAPRHPPRGAARPGGEFTCPAPSPRGPARTCAKFSRHPAPSPPRPAPRQPARPHPVFTCPAPPLRQPARLFGVDYSTRFRRRDAMLMDG
jgi:hypothetical protein